MKRLLDEIKRIHDAKVQAHIIPDYAIHREIRIEGLTMDEIEGLAKDLEEAGIIRIGATLNNKYYQLLND